MNIKDSANLEQKNWAFLTAEKNIEKLLRCLHLPEIMEASLNSSERCIGSYGEVSYSSSPSK